MAFKQKSHENHFHTSSPKASPKTGEQVRDTVLVFLWEFSQSTGVGGCYLFFNFSHPHFDQCLLNYWRWSRSGRGVGTRKEGEEPPPPQADRSDRGWDLC